MSTSTAGCGTFMSWQFTETTGICMVSIFSNGSSEVFDLLEEVRHDDPVCLGLILREYEQERADILDAVETVFSSVV